MAPDYRANQDPVGKNEREALTGLKAAGSAGPGARYPPELATKKFNAPRGCFISGRSTNARSLQRTPLRTFSPVDVQGQVGLVTEEGVFLVRLGEGGVHIEGRRRGRSFPLNGGDEIAIDGDKT